jgi:hypothetical protein
MIARKHLLDKQEEISQDTMDTNAPFITIVIPPNSHISMNMHIPSEPLTPPCKYYITKERPSPQHNNAFTFM